MFRKMSIVAVAALIVIPWTASAQAAPTRSAAGAKAAPAKHATHRATPKRSHLQSRRVSLPSASDTPPISRVTEDNYLNWRSAGGGGW
jgi:hypothetical protein